MKAEAGFELVITDEKITPPTKTHFSDAWNPSLVDEVLGILCRALSYNLDHEVKSAIEELNRMIDEMFFEFMGKERTQIKESIETERIHVTARNLETLYHTMMTTDDIDESIFVKSKSVNRV